MKKYLITAFILSAAIGLASEKTLVDFFQPVEPQGPLLSEGIWGNDSVLPRDVNNGLEDPTMQNWCYWDGQIVKDDAGKYHMYASRWHQTNSHSKGWNTASKGMHAISDNLLGPYKDQGMAWPDWQEGDGHNVIGLRLNDGRYAMVTSEVTPGNVFVSDSPTGPWEHLGPLQIDYNGFYGGLAHYDELDDGAVRVGTVGHMANVMIITRPDGRYMIVARHCAPMISDNGILGPYRILADKAWRGVEGIEQYNMEDPTVWYSDGLYHIVVNFHGADISYHLTSEDGIHNWTNRGLAYHHDKHIFRYTDGTDHAWHTVQRPTVYTEDGLVKAFNFSVIDVHKGWDKGNDQHGSKITVVPFNGKAFNRHIRSIVDTEQKLVGQTPPPAPWKSVDIGNVPTIGSTGYETKFNTFRLKAANGSSRFVYQKMSGDISATVLVMAQDITDAPVNAGLLLRQSLEPNSAAVSASISKSGGLILKNGTALIEHQDLKAPYWLRMEKRENRITLYRSSSNDMNWKKVGETKVELEDSFYAGMMAAAPGLARFKDPDFHVWGEPVHEGVINHTFPDMIPTSGKITFEVEYDPIQVMDVFVELQNIRTREKFIALRQRLKKKNTIELTYDCGQTLVPGDMYWFVLKTLPKHGHENMAIQSTFKKVVVE